MNGNTIKNIILFGLSTIGGFIVNFFGGVDTALTALIIFMAIDYITGLAVAFVFHKSKKTAGGGASSKEGFKGIVKKICMLLLVGLAHELDLLMGVDYTRATAILFFIGNEGLSVLENVGLMGVKYPKFLTKALEVLRDNADDEPVGDTPIGDRAVFVAPTDYKNSPVPGTPVPGEGVRSLSDGGERNE